MPTVYDTGVLTAADAGNRQLWSEHRARLESGRPPLVPAAAVAQASRSPGQADLRRLLSGCEVVELTEQRAHRCGALLAASGTSDAVDASVVELATDVTATIVTSDPRDIGRLIDAAGSRLPVVTI